ncbi:DUF4856 domain-containing protein [Aureivirga sp. CE67]|uniref:DUF4856 domain-containing protein n=1 Tax=Aureivirga sp. CE67 TaxID=1788983 RepID=UPI0018CA902A|nr:DUF4856 domain-containing protein [Aureivirga sp. CE67]
MKKILLSTVALSTLFFASCSSDDDNNDNPSTGIEVPATYKFTREGSSTVSFGGQTTRIAMAEEIISKLKDNSYTEAQLDGMFAHEEGGNDFSDADLNASSKNVRSKTAASFDFFSNNQSDATAIKEMFDMWIAKQVDDVFPNWNELAAAGSAGQIADGTSTRYVNANGLEFNQLFGKSLIGALMADQALNNYLSDGVLDAGTNVEENNNGTVAEGKTYTTMEHKWDEAYGYVYGASQNPETPNATIGDDDSFLNKYIGKVNADEDFAGIADEIYNAFKKGRAAIVAKEYGVRDEQVSIIREAISKVIAVRAVNYLQAGKDAVEGNEMGTAFHDLSEGYGFIYSLQFTRKSGTGQPYFTKGEVDTMISKLMAGTNGLWDVTPATLDELSNEIAAKFNFTVDQAK